MTASRWFHTLSRSAEPRVRLYCLPCAGGGGSMYRPWADLVPDWVELRAVLLPGRQSRYSEAPLTDVEDAVAVLTDEFVGQLEGHDDGVPVALFGHSMGALLGYRITRRLCESGRAPLLFAAAAWPVHGVLDDGTDPADPDSVHRAVTVLGGAAARILDDPEMRAIALPVLQADFALCATYRYRSDETPLPVPVAVYGGTDDPVTTPAELDRWHDAAGTVLGPRLFPGGHFFFQDDPQPLVEALVTDLATALERPDHRRPGVLR